MFKKIFIVNRGEIVVRIICVCREFGILIVVIYLEIDKDVLYVKIFDEVYCIGKIFVKDSYFNV